MLPSTLDITREECRGILRRLELESYSNVVSTFRAQGGLNDIKKKILEDLRGVFHISQDRHRAEVRRVANDEKLCTIAEVISGPNTSQEWCQEGRRSFPLLARSLAYTAFSSVASAVAEKLIIENSKLPSSSEIQQQKEANSEKTEITEENFSNIPIVKEDPCTPTLDEKKKIKRPISRTGSQTAVAPLPPSQRKRTISNENSKQLDEHNQIHTNLQIQQIYHNHCKTVARHKKSSATKRKVSTVKETPVDNIKIQQQYKNNSAMNNIVETMPSMDNKMSLNVPNPQVLHTYASLSQKSATQNNSRHIPYGGSIDVIQPSLQIKNCHGVVASKKEIFNNGSKLNLSLPKQIISEEKKNDRISNSLQLRQIQEKNIINNSSAPNDASLLPPRVLMVGNKLTTIIAEKNTNKTEQTSNNNETNVNREIFNNLSVRQTSINSSGCKSPTIVQIKPPQSVVSMETKRVVRELSVENSNMQPQEKSTFLNHSLPLVAKRKIHISNPQIIHPIKISSAGLQGIQNRKGIKIISSANGQVFIQSADNKVISSSSSSPKLAKIIPAQKGVISPTRAITPVSGIVSGGSITSTIIPNRVAIQKVHILPKTNKQQTILTKSSATNQIFMQTTNVANNVTITPEAGTATANEIIKNQSLSGNVILEKSKHENNIVLSQKLIQPVTTTNNLIPIPSQSPQSHNNVIVIGSIPPSKKETDNNSQDLISHNSNHLHKNSMITEDTPVYILTAPVTNLDKSSIDLNCITTTEADDENFDHRTESVQIINNEITEVVEDETEVQTENPELHIEFSEDNDEERQNMIIDDSEKQSSKKEFIYEVTDWEVELANLSQKNDQEAIRSKDKNISQNSKISGGNTIDFPYSQQQSKQFIETTTNGDSYMGDNFHDVIEVEGIESEDSMIEESNVNYETSYSSQII